jgi:hypothetical protein
MDQATAERIAVALEGILEQMKREYEQPRVILAGYGVLDPDSPEARMAKLAMGGQGVGPLKT